MTISKSILISTATLALVGALGATSSQQAAANQFVLLSETSIAATNATVSATDGYNADTYVKFNDGQFPQAGILDKTVDYNLDGKNEWNAGWSLAHTSFVIGYITAETDIAALQAMITEKAGLQLHSSTEIVSWDWSDFGNFDKANGGNCINIMLTVTNKGVQQPAQIYIATDPSIATPILAHKNFDPSTVQESDYKFEYHHDHAVFIGYTGTEKELVIPSEVYDANGIALPVTQVGNGTTIELPSGMTDIVIPEGVKKIGYGAFARYFSFETVVFPEGLEEIGAHAFECNKLTTVEIPDSVVSIGAAAFYFNDLESVKLSNSLTVIEADTFKHNWLTSLVIPDGVTAINDRAFDTNDIETISLPDSIEYIGVEAFKNNDFKDLTLPANLVEIGEQAFINTALENLQFNDKLEIIGRYAFNGSNIKHDLYFPNSLKEIRTGAFANLKIKHAHVPNVHTKIDNTAFAAATIVKVGDLVAPASDHVFAFYDDHAVVTGYIGTATDIVVPSVAVNEWGEEFPVTEIGKDAYLVRESGTENEYLKNGVTSIVIPEGIEIIGEGAFGSNYNLTEIIIPASVKVIESSAFVKTGIATVNFPHPESWYNVGLPNDIYQAFFLGDTTLNFPAEVVEELTQDVQYEWYEGKVLIKNYIGTATDVVVPSVVFDENGEALPVYGISKSAYSNKGITSVVIPEGIVQIFGNAFKGNPNLTSVEIPESVTVIASGAFTETGLTSVNLAHKEEWYIFSKNGVRDAFDAGVILNFEVNGSATTEPEAVAADFQVEFSNGAAKITGYTGEAKNVVIPDTFETVVDGNVVQAPVTEIGVGAFINKGLDSVEIPHTVTKIAKSAFANNNLTSLVLPTSIQTISVGAFANNALTGELIINAEGPSLFIGAHAFMDNALQSVVIYGLLSDFVSYVYDDDELNSFDQTTTVTIKLDK